MAAFVQVALLVDTSTDYSSHIIQGVAQFVREHKPWQLLVQSRGERERSMIPQHWRPDGVIARITRRSMAVDLRRRRIPVVNVSLSRVPGFNFPQVTIDERLIGIWAAKYLWELGLRHFGYCPLLNQPNYTDQCEHAFVKQLAQFGHSELVLRPPRRRASIQLAMTIANLQAWLRKLPKPVGILASDAEDAHNLAQACAACELRVPDDVAIVAGEDDKLLCAISYPPLSCVDHGSERIGYEAAALLAGLLAGRRPPARPRLIPPLRITSRHSTNTLAIEDEELVQAIRFIRERFADAISVRDILRAVPLSRRALEQRFRKVVGRTPAAEIRRCRIERAKELLVSTDWAMPRIADAAGFSYTEVMNQVFRRELRLTPTEFRRKTRIPRHL